MHAAAIAQSQAGRISCTLIIFIRILHKYVRHIVLYYNTIFFLKYVTWTAVMMQEARCTA